MVMKAEISQARVWQSQIIGPIGLCFQHGYFISKHIETECIFGSDNGLSPVRDQAIIQINAGFLLNGHLERHFAEIVDG